MGFLKSDRCNLRGVEFVEGTASSPSKHRTKPIWQRMKSSDNNHAIREINEVRLGCFILKKVKRGGVSESNRDMWREERGELQLPGKASLKRCCVRRSWKSENNPGVQKAEGRTFWTGKGQCKGSEQEEA